MTRVNKAELNRAEGRRGVGERHVERAEQQGEEVKECGE